MSELVNPTLLQMKYSRVICLLAKALGISIPDAMDVFTVLRHTAIFLSRRITSITWEICIWSMS